MGFPRARLQSSHFQHCGSLDSESPSSTSDVLVIVPTYNEAENIAELVERVESLRRRLPVDLLIVDDNSPDGTAHIVQALQDQRPWLLILTRDRRSGLGSAYRAGFTWALTRRYSFVCEMDADLSHDPADVESLHRVAAAGADLVLGSRYVDGGGVVGWPLRRKALSWGANLFARRLLELGVRDVTAGFRMYTRRALGVLLRAGTECDGYGFQIEGVLAVEREGLEVAEVPIVFRDRERGSSKMSKRIALEAARRCLSLAWDETTEKGTKESETDGAVVGVVPRSPRTDGPPASRAVGTDDRDARKVHGVRCDPATIAAGSRARPGFGRGPRVQRFARFGIVGASGLLVHQLALWAATDVLGFHYLISAVLATQCSTTWNFALTEGWVFKADPPGRWTRLFWFAAMNNAWLIGRIPFLFILTESVGLHYLASNLVVLVTATVVRFSVSENWIWAVTADRPDDSRDSRARHHFYDVHGLARIASAARLPELEAFRVKGLVGPPDIMIEVSNRGFGGLRPRITVDRNGNDMGYVEHLGGLGFAMRAKVGAITRIQVSRMLRYSPHVLYTNVVEPFLRWLLVDKGFALVHGACLRVSGKGVLISAHTDTGKTTTCLRSLRAHGSGFLSDDMVIVSPEGAALGYPKPLTVSAHTLRAAKTAPLPLWRKGLLQLQGRIHSRTGRGVGLALGRLNLPVATLNGFLQMVVPPPKYFVGQLVRGVRVLSALRIDHVVLIGRGPEARENVDPGPARETLMANTEDAYGFPPYPAIADALVNGKRSAEERIYGSLMERVTVTRLITPDRTWHLTLPLVVSESSAANGRGKPVDGDLHEPVAAAQSGADAAR
jgi:dolichol-phosphate mannosyltransferase